MILSLIAFPKYNDYFLFDEIYMKYEKEKM